MLVFADEGADLVGQLLGNFALDDLIAVLLVGGLLIDEAGLDVEDLAEAAGDLVEQVAVFRLLHLLGDLVGVDEDRLDRRRRGQHVHICVVDHAARGGEVRRARLVFDGLLVVIVMLGDHEMVERADERNKRNDAAQDHQDQRAAEDGAVCPLVLLPVCLLLLLGARQADDFSCHETAFLLKKGAVCQRPPLFGRISNWEVLSKLMLLWEPNMRFRLWGGDTR